MTTALQSSAVFPSLQEVLMDSAALEILRDEKALLLSWSWKVSGQKWYRSQLLVEVQGIDEKKRRKKKKKKNKKDLPKGCIALLELP